MFQFRAFPSYAYLIQRTIHRYCLCGFPHSEITGSTDICSSPMLIAACHVLRRLLMPRHSPCALYSLTLRDILVLLFGIMQAINRLLSQNCNCYPHLFRCSTIKYHKLLSTYVERPLCCLAFHHILRCSVFMVQCRQHKLRITRRAASGTSHSLRCVSSSRHKRFRWFVPRVRA